jgi:hypothetical protein
VAACNIDIANKYIWIDIMHHEDYFKGPPDPTPPLNTIVQTLIIKTQKLAISGPITPGTELF